MALPFIDQLSASERPGFARSVVAMATRLGIRPEWAMVVMMRESELKPTARNPYSGATGLIQFMPQTATGLGTTVQQLARMSATQQLVYVEAYWRQMATSIGRTPKSVYDLYLLTLHPRSVGKSDASVVFAAGTAAYRQNSSLDAARQGYVTVADVKRFVDGVGGSVGETAAVGIGALLFASGLTWLVYRYYVPSN